MIKSFDYTLKYLIDVMGLLGITKALFTCKDCRNNFTLECKNERCKIYSKPVGFLWLKHGWLCKMCMNWDSETPQKPL